MCTHILVPTDGSELAQHGVNHALSLAKALGSKVTIITATEPFPIIYGRHWQPGPQEVRRFEEENSKASTDLLMSIKADAEKMGISADIVHVPNKTAAAAIVETAEALGCNLIVMSSHGRRGIVRAILGSQTTEVLAQSPVPVLVVR